MTTDTGLTPVLSASEVTALMRRVYPQLGAEYSITDVRPGFCLARLEADERHLRPGGTVSGPTLFTLADIGGYGCALSHIGPEELAVTTDLNINMVFDAALYWRHDNSLIAHATGTYSIPTAR